MTRATVMALWLLSFVGCCVGMVAPVVWVWVCLGPDDDASRAWPAMAIVFVFAVAALSANEGFYRLARMVSLREYVEARLKDGADPEEALIEGRRIQNLVREVYRS